MEEFQGEQKSYEEAKLNTLIAVLATIGIEVQDVEGKITITKDGDKLASVQITRNNKED